MLYKPAWYAALTLSCIALLGCQSTSAGSERRVSSVSSAQLSENAEVLKQQLELTLSSQQSEAFLAALTQLLESNNIEAVGGEQREGEPSSQWKIQSSTLEFKTFLVRTDIMQEILVDGEMELLDLPYRATTTVNLRAGPSAKSNKVGQLQTGDVFIALAKVPEQPWLLVERQGAIEGYVHQAYVQSRIEPRNILSVKPNTALSLKANSNNDQSSSLLSGRYQCRDVDYQLMGVNESRTGSLLACRKDKDIWYIQSINPS